MGRRTRRSRIVNNIIYINIALVVVAFLPRALEGRTTLEHSKCVLRRGDSRDVLQSGACQSTIGASSNSCSAEEAGDGSSPSMLSLPSAAAAAAALFVEEVEIGKIVFICCLVDVVNIHVSFLCPVYMCFMIHRRNGF
jgi:hypothetical protein